MRNLFSRPGFSRWALALGLTGALAACQNAGSSLGFDLTRSAAINVLLYLDRDGSRTPTNLDTSFAKARVALLAHGTNDTVKIQTSSGIGVARFDAVPVGQYRIAVVQSSIGDSITVAAIDTNEVTLAARDTAVNVIVRLSYPELTIRQARALPLGKRAFIRGVVLAGVQSFRDTTSHIADSSGQIRLTRVALRGGLTGNNPGDSVSVLGVASSRAGQPTLDQSLLTRIGSRPAPIAFSLNTASAATASGGTLDAALVQVIGVNISDTVAVSPDFQVTASDGSGPVKIILDANLGFPRTLFRPGHSINVKGVLVPDGLGGWNLKPRDFSDVVFNN